MHWMHTKRTGQCILYVSHLLGSTYSGAVECTLYTHTHTRSGWSCGSERARLCVLSTYSGNRASVLVLVVWRYYIFGSPPLFMVAFDSISLTSNNRNSGGMLANVYSPRLVGLTERFWAVQWRYVWTVILGNSYWIGYNSWVSDWNGSNNFHL